MKMKITRPQEMESGVSKLEEAVQKFEIEFTKEDKDEKHYFLIICGEYNRQCCDMIEKIYSEAGWVNVKCETSSEAGENPGLTSLGMYRI